MIFEEPSEFETLRKEFYRLSLFAQQVSRSARNYKRQGKEDEFQAAMSAFRVLARQAKEVYRAMDSMREARPLIVETDVCIEEDMRLTCPELFLPPEQGGYINE